MKKWTPKQAKKARTFRQIRAGIARAKLWRLRWQTHPESMRANLDKINAGRKRDAAEVTKGLGRLLEHLPKQMQSGEMRKAIATALERAGKKGQNVEATLSLLRRRSMISFDHQTLTWTVAYPRLDDTVGS